MTAPQTTPTETAELRLALALAGDVDNLDDVDLWETTPRNLAKMILACLPAELSRAVVLALNPDPNQRDARYIVMTCLPGPRGEFVEVENAAGGAGPSDAEWGAHPTTPGLFRLGPFYARPEKHQHEWYLAWRDHTNAWICDCGAWRDDPQESQP